MQEEKEEFRQRAAQAIKDIVVNHFITMSQTGKAQQVLSLVAHHNHIPQFMKVFNRNEFVHKKPVYCWTGVVELQANAQSIITATNSSIYNNSTENRNSIFN